MAIREVAKEEADEHFVVVISDANLRRYGISPRHVRVKGNPPKDFYAFSLAVLHVVGPDLAERTQGSSALRLHRQLGR